MGHLADAVLSVRITNLVSTLSFLLFAVSPELAIVTHTTYISSRDHFHYVNDRLTTSIPKVVF